MEELITSNMMQIEAIVRILEREGIVTQYEGLQAVKKIKQEMEEQIKNSLRMI